MKVTETKCKSHRQELPGEATAMVRAKKLGTFPGQSQIPSHRGQGGTSSALLAVTTPPGGSASGTPDRPAPAKDHGVTPQRTGAFYRPE